MAMMPNDNLPLVPQTPAIGQRVTRKFVERLADNQRKQAMASAWQAYLGMLPNPLKTEPGEPDLNVNVNRIAPIVDTGVAWLMGAALGIEVDPEQPLLALDDEDALDDGRTVEGSIGNASDPDAAQDAVERAQGIPDADALNIGDVDSDEANGAVAAIDAALKTPEAAENPKVKAAQGYLDGCWGDEDERMTTLAKLATNGGMCGHFFAKILPPDASAGRQYPRLVILDPQTVTMQTDPEDCDTVRCYTITFDAESPVDGSLMQKRQCIEYVDAGPAGPRGDYWNITNYARGNDGGDWVQLGPPRKWPWPWPPIVDGPNMPLPNQRWGAPDVTPNLIGLNRAINFVASNINAIGYSHGHPWLWASGVNTHLLRTQPGYVTGIPNPAGQMGAIQAHGDIAGLMQYEADLRADMDEQSKVPAVATGRISELPRGQQSGVTIRLLHTPLTFKTTFKQRTYGKAIREANARMLALGGFGDGTDLGGVKTLLHWQDPLPVDDLQQAQAALAWTQVGLSADTALSKAGFDPEVERRKNEQANARELTNFAQGKGMPPVPAAPPDATETPAQPAQPDATSQPQPQAHPQPPVNDPAALAMQQAVKSAGRAVKASRAAAGKPAKATRTMKTATKTAKGGA